MKIISAIENSLGPRLLEQKFSPEQRTLLKDFLANPNNYSDRSVKTSERIHADGSTERWIIQLSEDLAIFIDGSVPSPWSTSDEFSFFGSVVVVGYDLGDEFYLP